MALKKKEKVWKKGEGQASEGEGAKGKGGDPPLGGADSRGLSDYSSLGDVSREASSAACEMLKDPAAAGMVKGLSAGLGPLRTRGDGDGVGSQGGQHSSEDAVESVEAQSPATPTPPAPEQMGCRRVISDSSSNFSEIDIDSISEKPGTPTGGNHHRHTASTPSTEGGALAHALESAAPSAPTAPPPSDPILEAVRAGVNPAALGSRFQSAPGGAVVSAAPPPGGEGLLGKESSGSGSGSGSGGGGEGSEGGSSKGAASEGGSRGTPPTAFALSKHAAAAAAPGRCVVTRCGCITRGKFKKTISKLKCWACSSAPLLEALSRHCRHPGCYDVLCPQNTPTHTLPTCSGATTAPAPTMLRTASMGFETSKPPPVSLQPSLRGSWASGASLPSSLTGKRKLDRFGLLKP